MTLRLAALVTSCLCAGVASAQTSLPNLTRQQRELLQGLVAAVDRASAAPSVPASDAWLTHVLRASDGSHYVAFSVTPRAAALTDKPIVLYVRLTTAAGPGTIAERSIVREWLLGSRTDPRLLPPRRGVAIGDMPPMGAGAVGVRGAASVGSADLQAMDLERQRARERRAEEEKARRATLEGTGGAPSDRLPFEDFEVRSSATFADGTRAIQRALTAGPGTYDLYVAWVDASQPANKALPHVVRRSLQLGPAAAADFGLSSIIVADRIGMRPSPYPSLEQRAHPYTIGVTEIVPAQDTVFTPADQISVAFQIVNPTPLPSGKPDVGVNLRIARLSGVREESVAMLSPLAYNATTLPDDFDVRAGHPLIAAMSAPLATIPRGRYRLLITAEDKVSGTVVGGATEFTVVGTAAGLLAEAPTLGGRFDVNGALQPAIVSTLLDRLVPGSASEAIARALQSARTGRFADLLVEEPVVPTEQGVREALSGLALLSLGNPGAVARFERALTARAPSAPIQFLLGAARAMQSRDAEAIAAWQAARAGGIPPAVVDPLLAEAHLRRGEHQLAAAAIEGFDDPATTKTWAATRLATRREGEAIAALDQLLARNPDDADARWLLLHALYAAFVNGDRGRRDRFEQEARRYIAANGANAALAAEWLKAATTSS